MIVETIQEQMAKMIKYIKPTEYGSATALASYQVDASIIKNFRSQYPDDTQLIAATAWASFAAARRVGMWFAEPFAMVGRG